MTPSNRAVRNARWLVPVAIAGVTAVAIIGPTAASGAEHPKLPTITAAQLLADLRGASVPDFTGTVVATSNLGLPAIPSSDLAGSSGSSLSELETLLTGSHTMKIAYGGETRQRIAVLMSNLSETDVVHNGTDVWTYESSTNSVTHTKLPTEKAKTDASKSATAGIAITPEAAAQSALSAIAPSTAVTVDQTASVAGRPAYQLDLAPKTANTLIGSIRIAMDSATHLPLRVQVFSTSNPTTPAFQEGFTDLELHTPAASTFVFSTPPGATTSDGVTGLLGGSHDATKPTAAGAAEPTVATLGKDWSTVLSVTLPASTDKAGAKTGQGVKAGSTDSTLDSVLTTVPQGKLLSTALVSVLITHDNRILVGAVTPSYLESLAK